MYINDHEERRGSIEGKTEGVVVAAVAEANATQNDVLKALQYKHFNLC
jgi:hypothetical protein